MEYVAAASATQEAIWIRCLLSELGEPQEGPTSLFIDNQSAIRLIKNPEYHKRTKHIDIQYHFIRQKYADEKIVPIYVPSEDQLANVLTKLLSRQRFQKLRFSVELRNIQTETKLDSESVKD